MRVQHIAICCYLMFARLCLSRRAHFARPRAARTAQALQGPVKITLDDAIQWRCSTITRCSRRAPRSSRARPRKLRRTCVRIPCCWATRSSCRSFIRTSSTPTISTTPRSSISASAICSSAARSASTACRRRRTHGGHALAGGRQRAHPYVPGGLAVHQRRARRIHARSGASKT